MLWQDLRCGEEEKKPRFALDSEGLQRYSSLRKRLRSDAKDTWCRQTFVAQSCASYADKRMHTPSIKDIARLAGVAPSTVSRALSGSDRVSDDTRRRIRAIAEDLDYTPSAIARSLVTGASATLGIVAPSLADPYVAAVMRGIEDGCGEAGYHLLVAATGGDPEREVAMVKLLARQHPSGLIILSSRAGQAYRDLLPALGVPVVFVNADQVGEQVFSIATDNEYGAWLATRHLLDRGHRRVAYLTGPSAGRSQQARAAGYRRALQETKVDFDPRLMLVGDGTITAGREALRALLVLPAAIRPTAIFCYNDLSALGLLAEAHVHAVRVPTDLAVVGFDNVPYAEVSLPPLTTVDQRKEEMGRLAVHIILAAYRGEPVSDIHLRGAFVVRSTT